MDLPTGTVTFLFTDIEGSTKLAQQYHDAWEILRKQHHDIVRTAIEAHNGYVFQVIGDALCAAFSTAAESVRAAVKAQTDLNAEKWVEGACIKVRMGIHTGRAQLQESGDYVGYLTMSRVQRLMSAAHGGQILLSLAAQNQVFDDLPENVILRDMGEHRLKNIVQPEHIYQLVIPGVASDFPPLKTLTSFSHPPQVGLTVRLIGRFEIKFDNRPIQISSRTAQALFAYLILNPGISHRREKLAGMFWPDEPEEKARAYLRHELWRIRKALSSRSKNDFLFADAIDISFVASTGYWLDVDVLKNVSDISASEQLKSTLSFSLGELLPGFYQDWIIAEREHVQVIYEQKMAQLLSLLESEKRWQEVLEWAECWISLGQGSEAAYRALMIAYDALGDHARVAATYQRCVRALRELDLEPSEQTRALGFKRTSKLNIPVPLTSFIGRETELKEVAQLLSKSRLVTLTGSGGVGKTRLAIQVVADVLDRFPDGVWFLDLAPLTDPALVPSALAGVLDLQLMGDSDSITDLITGYLRSRSSLMIFDNCEHLIESCTQLVHSLLTSCEYVCILATSREALRVSGEIPYRVPSLDLPKWGVEPVIDSLARTESVRLFTERARIVSPGFGIGPQNALPIGKICQRLDGIPLAIELAAARANVLAVEQILQHLDDRFNFLTRGSRTALPRHQTLRAMIEWSYDLLSQRGRLLFQRLAVFIGGWTLEAAEAVCSGSMIESSDVLDLLSQLVDKSLVQVETASNSETRYRRLETIRQFACEKFAASSEWQQIHASHLKYFLKLAQSAELECHSEKMVAWFQKLENEQENLRVALEWSLQGSITEGQQLASALSSFEWWGKGGHVNEGYVWLGKMLAMSAGQDTLLRAKLLSEAGWLAASLDYTEQSIALSEESLALCRQLGDKEVMAFALVTLGTRAFVRSDYDQAAALFQEGLALYREAENKPGMERVLTGLGYTAEAQGDFEQAEKFYAEGLMIAKELGMGGPLYFMGNLAVSQGDDGRAMALYEEALRIQKAVKAKNMIAWILNEMGMISIRSGHYEKASRFLEEGLEAGQKTGKPADMAYSRHGLGMVARLQGDFAKARLLYTECLRLVQPLHLERDVNMAEYLIGVSHVMATEDLFEKFAHLLGMAEGVAPHIQRILSEFLRRETEKFIELARASLGNEAYIAAWDAGRRMSLDESVAYALRELQ